MLFININTAHSDEKKNQDMYRIVYRGQYKPVQMSHLLWPFAVCITLVSMVMVRIFYLGLCVHLYAFISLI